MNKQTENIIRDWLAINLNFIEPGLKLINKEYYLRDTIGSKGFIDLLCTDIYNNYVIIEIKRSNVSSRQTITEVLKYYSLLKYNFKARESEIRIIIISSHWNELIRAFSETYYKTNIAIKGYQINLNSNNIPNSIEVIKPLSEFFIKRKFGYWQGLYLFKTIEKRKLFHEKLNFKLSKIPLHDYVSVDLNGPSNNKRIVTPYAIAVAFQNQLTTDLLNGIIKLNTSEEIDIMERSEFEDETSYDKHIQDAFISSLEMYNYSDDVEAGYSEKLDSMLNAQGWVVTQILRYGIFKTDARYNDELLLSELQGHDGNSRNKFVGFAESTQPERIREIREECMNSLLHTPQWSEFIQNLFESLKQKQEKFRLLIDIYNPDSIITSFYFTMSNANPNYLPLYQIFIDYIDFSKTEIYIGELNWNNKTPYAKLFNLTNKREISDEVFRVNTIPNNEIDSYAMALIYTNKKTIITGNNKLVEEFVTINDGKVEHDDVSYKSIESYVISNQARIKKFISNYNEAFVKM